MLLLGSLALFKALTVKSTPLATQILAMTAQYSLRACNGRSPSDLKRVATFRRNLYESTLDYILINIESWALVFDLKVVKRPESDHDPVLLDLI